jgi:nitroreductase
VIDQPVEKEKLERIIESAQLSPSACNAQPWKIIVVNDPEVRTIIADATCNRVVGINHFTKQAPISEILSYNVY